MGADIGQQIFTLRNGRGLEARFSSYGARWLAMYVPDCHGRSDDVLLGFDDVGSYRTAHEQYYGAIVGRVCGRIGGASFESGGRVYELAANDIYGYPKRNHLHGGIEGFHRRMWHGQAGVNAQGEQYVAFTYRSAEGEEGYPGNLEACVRYTLTLDNALDLLCTAVTDRRTPVNLTNHAFFNLAGARSGQDILDHRLRLEADRIIECDDQLLPTGRLLSVEDTVLDFRRGCCIASSLSAPQYGISCQRGFSLAYALSAPGVLPCVAELCHPSSGRKLSISTNQPSMQVYTGYLMDGSDVGKGCVPYRASAGIALEPQSYPDAVHHGSFPSVWLEPGEEYVHHTVYCFDIESSPLSSC